MLREVYDHAPADLTPPEMNLLVAVAWTARDSTREAHFRDGQEQLIRLARMDAKQLGRAFAKLDARGLQLRVPMRDRDGRPRFRKDGQPLYAARGHVSVLRVPHLAPPAAPVDNSGKPPADGGLPNRERPPRMDRKTPADGSKDPRIRGSQEVNGGQGKSISARATADLWTAAVEELSKRRPRKAAEITETYGRMAAERYLGALEQPPRNPVAYLRACIRNAAEHEIDDLCPTPGPAPFRKEPPR